MKTTLIVATVACLFLGGLWLSSSAQEQEKKQAVGQGQTQKGDDQMPACCKQMMEGMPKGEMKMPECCQKMMQGMTMQGMAPEMMERMQLLMRTPIFLDSPCPIYAQADKLGLSERQKKRLGEIEKEARQKARAVLTPEQRAKLGTVPDKPVTMMETCPMMQKQKPTQRK